MKTFLPLLLLLASVAAWSQPGGTSDQHHQKGEQQRQLTANQAAAIAVKRHGGRVLNITPQGKNYRVRLLLSSGKVIQVSITPNDVR